MANITAKRNGEFMRMVFELLINRPEGMQAKQILESVGRKTDLTEFERGYYPSSPDSPRYIKIVRFASIPLEKAGWLIKSKGNWYLTDEGRFAYTKYKNPETFYKEAYQLYQDWRKKRHKEKGLEDLEKEEEEEPQSVTLTFEEAEENAWQQIQDYMKGLDGFEFQELVADLLRGMDYHVAWIAPPGKDQGVDIIAYTDPLGVSNPRIKVQVKHRMEQSTNVNDLRSFLSTLGKDDVGIFVSSGGFTKDATDEARTQESRKITLLSLDAFFDLWQQFYEKLSQDARRKLPLKPIYFLAPDD